MITLSLTTPEELAEAIYLSEQTVMAFATSGVGSDNSWRPKDWKYLNDMERSIKIEAATRLVALYKVSGLSF